MTTLIAVGSAPESSSDFTIVAGGAATLRLFGAASGPIGPSAVCAVEFKVGSVYTPYCNILGTEPAVIIDGDPLAATTWRVTRNPNMVSTASYGVDRAA